ncbi:TonB-dependent receptor domain-containing protein [Massilia sp. DWR3-1-1]|uniref:TonB-dependent receptor domain-containing protein n=1 Tax=Massilia sp. DWR3-1-1 TaxID=2804559 RepID=UPI003CEDFE2F
MASSQFVQAQEAAQPITKVTITGSNIKRAEKEGTSPVEVMTAKQIAATGASTVQDLLHSIPAFGSGSSIDVVDGSFSKGASTASLRGLGSSSTLILLNGRRITASAYADPNQGKSAVYDLNTIPISAIERVEIFKDGASAVYGSDAIAGVVNFITKSEYKGAQLSANYSGNGKNEFNRKAVNGIFGFGDLNKDRYNVFVSADIAERGRTMISDVDAIDKTRLAAINNRLNPLSSNLSDQAFFYRERTPNLRNFANSYALRADVINRTNCPTGNQVTGDMAANNLLATSTLVGRTFCNFNLNDYTEAQGTGKDYNVLSRATIQLSPDVQSFTEFGYSRSDRDYLGAPRSFQSTSPSTVFSTGAAQDFQIILPIGHPDNPFPTSRSAVGLRMNAKGGSDNKNETVRLVTGLKGTTGAFDWETAAMYNRNERTENYFGLLYRPTLARIMTENRTLAATLADPTSTATVTNRNFSQVVQLDAKASTTIGKLPGGDIGLAFGVEGRQEKIGLTPDVLTQRGDIVGLANSAIDGSRKVYSAFVETRTPFAKTFEMDFAARYDKYPNDKSFVPKVGAKWDISPMATVRGTFARGFRAPALIQVSPGGVQSFSTVTDTARCPDGVKPLTGADQVDCSKGISSLSAGTPGLAPEKSKSYSLGLILAPTRDIDVLIDYYNIRKEQETALLSAQYVIDHPDLYPGAAVRATNVGSLLVDGSGKPIPGTGPLTAVNRSYVNQGSTQVSGLAFEVAMRKSLGDQGTLSGKLNWEYVIDYTRAERPGEAEANAAGTAGGISDWATSVGDIPRNRGSYTLNWTRGVHALSGSVDYVGPVSLLRRSENTNVYAVPYCHYGVGQPSTAYQLGGLAKFSDYSNGTCGVNSWTTFGMSYTYTGVKNLSVNFNIRNLLDTAAPYDPRYAVGGYNTQLHNGYGRFFKLSATYTF